LAGIILASGAISARVVFEVGYFVGWLIGGVW
jgi:hypothetical protein